ncbi:MAG: glycosyltransferase family 2 protein [Alphaproteobacteria bacterium]
MKISLIIPIYNVEDYLERCLRSLVIQTLEEIEIICINDASTDESRTTLEAFRVSDARIIVHHLPENIGAGEARNIGLKLAKGEFVICMDADDYADKRMCEVLYNKAKAKDADIVLCGAYIVADGGELLTNSYYSLGSFKTYADESCNIKESVPKAPWLPFSHLHPWAKLLKKSFLDKEKITFQNTAIANDNRFSVEAFLKAERVYFVSDELVFHLVERNESITFNTDRRRFDIFEVLEEVDRVVRSSADEDLLVKYLDHYKIDALMSNFKKISEEHKKEFFNKMLYIVSKMPRGHLTGEMIALILRDSEKFI